MPEPESPQAVPYQAYRSKRQPHSRNVSVSGLSPPPTNSIPPVQLAFDSYEKNMARQIPPAVPVVIVQPSAPASNGLPSPPASPSSVDVQPVTSGPIPPSANDTPTNEIHGAVVPSDSDGPDTRDPPSTSNTTPSSPTASSSGSPSQTNKPLPRLSAAGRKISTFRHVPRARATLSSSLLVTQSHSRNPSASSNLRHSLPPLDSTPSISTASPNRLSVAESRSRIASPSTLSKPLPASPPAVAATPLNGTGSGFVTSQPQQGSVSHVLSPPTRSTSLHPSPAVFPVPTASPPPSAATPPRASTPAHIRPPAPYRPGFQPKGIYRPRTDEFLALRKQARDGTDSSTRIVRTKLQRRLEKLINLHFPTTSKKETSADVVRPGNNRRHSSFFDINLDDLKRMSVADAGGLWKSITLPGGAKNDIRTAEQRITPWQDDASVSECPMCTASFHPLTNRKHHCRLCGQIICSLPVKPPQRPAPCSILFVVDPKTRKIEEVGEGVDYGVKRRRTGSMGGKKSMQEELDDSEKFLKGVRICRDCRPMLLRQQYQQEMVVVPTFSHYYAILVEVEKELEDSLPQFQELIVSLSHDEQPSKEASLARKRLLEMFAKYDAVAKRIRALPCRPGSSQDRVQHAVATRANAFLQKHMFPLQSLPKPKAKHKKSTSKAGLEESAPFIDPDSQVALAMQPLLEQEALLESFVEEATAQRKFEDAKTLRRNLGEIRAEIERMLTNANDGTVAGNDKGRKDI